MYIKKQTMQTRLSTWHCPHLLLSAVLSIDISDQQQTRRTPLLRSNDGTHRRTDTQTDGRPLHRAWCAYCACSSLGQQVRVTCSAAGHTGACEERITRRDGGVTGQHRERRRLTRSVHSQQTETLACRQHARLHTFNGPFSGTTR